MLVLARKAGESIIIGQEISVTVLEVKGEQVRLGITAPRELAVHREEVFVAIRDENRAAAGSAVDLGSLAALLARSAPGGKKETD
jgi:carbon storage regulator